MPQLGILNSQSKQKLWKLLEKRTNLSILLTKGKIPKNNQATKMVQMIVQPTLLIATAEEVEIIPIKMRQTLRPIDLVNKSNYSD